MKGNLLWRNFGMKIEKKYIEIPFDIIKNLIIEPCIKLTSQGLFIKAFDESNAVMCLFQLPKEKFIEYEFEKEQNFKISSELFTKILKRIKSKEINLNFKDEKLIIGDGKKEYSIAVMWDEEVERDVPQLDFNSNFKIECSKLKDLFLDAEIVTDNIQIETKEKIICSGGELNKFNEEVECIVTGEAKARYGLEYLNKFMNASKYFKDVLFEFSSDSPCKLSFNGDVDIQFILAARVDMINS